MFDFFKSTPKAYEDISVGEFHDLMLQKDAVIIDVRTAGEFAGGKLRGARNIDIMSRNFTQQIENLPKDKTYLLYCRSGNRSGQACQIMTEMGFKNVKNMARGIMSWPFETV
ncbi:rhodanese-like domain-containing protein [Algoriphagus sp. NF]|jgi:Rhodanese-related sulfurtransferase|uniref:Rhodanese-like domain-containing protein n=3 Tax=Algoriphagus TaxID=246875 RepID=A0ABS7N2X3_9BACT|nr:MULTISPECIES: rhodanese-like domain-containing protein [Algoriphagus]KPQ08884.1 MAG: rhodanese-related sulfurtransferase [Algoriphagus marincola HL-49]MBY5950365.1 rhodanese-like domain-containing protein [Algoriphagus marincola]MDE0560624.1 rhodanese-like domain-containing protein [Algoriphagus sp. NF]TDK42646.1 rhodanese-like domain-containing protein [Algoriphagus aquimaris]